MYISLHLKNVKLVDQSSVVVQNTGLKLEGLDEKAAKGVFPNKVPTSSNFCSG